MNRELKKKQWCLFPLFRDVSIFLMLILVGVFCNTFLSDGYLRDNSTSEARGDNQGLSEEERNAMIAVISKMEDEQKSEFSQDGISIIEIPLPSDDEIAFTGKRKIR